MASSAALRLRDVEKAAKAERKNIWTGYVPAPTNQTKLSDNFSGKVGRGWRSRICVGEPALQIFDCSSKLSDEKQKFRQRVCIFE